ncbi:hypothetical protein PIB30_118928 [Stylosanthes scabra]|uniref:Polyprotein n=1 Tax=Stylosanthes scabra TaxID=79078 RepID=A0ABU6WR99_9FABA|nr:hypothetical protein [Stylosanthes scabra]
MEQNSFIATPISMKLDEDNYLQWKDQALSTIEGNDMLNHVTGEEIPQQFTVSESGEATIVTPSYKKWKRQDSLLKSWLLASMSKPFTTRMVGCTFTHQVWKRLEDHFSSQIRAKVMQLKNKLSTVQIGASVTDYVLTIKSTIDALASVGESMKESDHVNAMLHGLTEDYAPLITSVLARSQSITVGELEALLLAHESMLNRFRKSETLIQANVAQYNQYGQGQNSRDTGQFDRGNFRGGFRGRGGRSFRGGRNNFNGGRSGAEQSDGTYYSGERGNYNRGRFGDRPQCQVCEKYGHTARTCWYIYSEDQYTENYSGNNQYNATQYNNQQVSQPKANFSNVMTTPSTVQDPNWYPDSVATHHMTHDEQNLTEKESYRGDEQVVIGNGTGHQASCT